MGGERRRDVRVAHRLQHRGAGFEFGRGKLRNGQRDHAHSHATALSRRELHRHSIQLERFRREQRISRQGWVAFPHAEKISTAVVSDYGKRDVSFQDVMRRTFDVRWNNPLTFSLNVLGWHDVPLEDDDPMNMNGTPREETEDTKAFLAVLASFSELSGKKIFVMGPGRFISALSRETAPANVFPISVDLNNGDWYTLDMH